MRIFDYTCDDCGTDFEYLIRDSAPQALCPSCGSRQCPRVYRPHTAPHVIQDSIPGGMVIENLNPTPTTFYSKSAYQQELRSRGMTNDRFHSKNPRGPHSTKW